MLDFDVYFSEDVVVDIVGGMLCLVLDIGGSMVYVSYLFGLGSNILYFCYMVVGGLFDVDGIVVGVLQVNGSQLYDVVGNVVVFVFNVVGGMGGVFVDSVVFQVIGLSVMMVDGSYKDGSVVFIIVGFDCVVQVSGMFMLVLNSGGYVDYVFGSGGSMLSFCYVVQFGDNVVDFDVVSVQVLILGGGIIVFVGVIYQVVQFILFVLGVGGLFGVVKVFVIDIIVLVISFVDFVFLIDFGSSVSDFIINVVVQILIVWFSVVLVVGECVYVLLDGGVIWIDVIVWFSGMMLSWSGIMLVGSNGFQFKVIDVVGNDSVVKIQVFVFDMIVFDKFGISLNLMIEQCFMLSGSVMLVVGEMLIVSVGGVIYVVMFVVGQWVLNLVMVMLFSGSLFFVFGQDYIVMVIVSDVVGNISSVIGMLSVLQVFMLLLFVLLFFVLELVIVLFLLFVLLVLLVFVLLIFLFFVFFVVVVIVFVGGVLVGGVLVEVLWVSESFLLVLMFILLFMFGSGMVFWVVV